MNGHLPRQSGSSRVSVLLFILATLGLWWVFAVLSHSVVLCLPAGDPCWHPLMTDTRATNLSEPVAITVLIISLLAALWAAQRLVFPPEDFSAPKAEKKWFRKMRERKAA